MERKIMKELRMFALALIFAASCTGMIQAQARSDKCHVYVVDVNAASKLQEQFFSERNKLSEADFERRLTTTQIVFDEFNTTIAEETSTTKTYMIPKTSKIITATVYYTDEMMASQRGADSMLMAITVGDKALPSAINAEGSAMSEVTLNNYDTARVKTVVNINRHPMLIGLQCENTALDKKDEKERPPPQ